MCGQVWAPDFFDQCNESPDLQADFFCRYLEQRLTMRVADLMVTDLTVVNEDTTMAEAVLQLADARVHGVPVVNRRGRLVGVLSSSDILQATAESTSAGDSNEVFSRTLVSDIMTTPPRTVRGDDDVRTAAQHMLELDVHRLFVEEDGDLLGVISQSDIVRAVATGKL